MFEHPQKTNTTPFIFPDTVGVFRFVRKLTVAAHAQNYLFALYESDQGQKAILKAWVESECPSPARQLLVDEIYNYGALSELQKHAQGFPADYRIPAFYESVVTASMCWLLIEYVHNQGDVSGPLTEAEFRAVERFVDRVGKLPGANRMFKTLSQSGLLLGFLPGLAVVCFKSRVFLHACLGLAKDFFRVVPALLLPGAKKLSHMDIKSENILLGESGKYVIDFQFLAFAHPLYELAFSWDRCFVIHKSSEQLSALVDHMVQNLSVQERILVRVLVTYGLLYDILFDHEQPLTAHEHALKKLILL